MNKKQIVKLKRDLEIMTADRDSCISMYRKFLENSIQRGKTIDISRLEFETPNYDGRSIANAKDGLRAALNISDDMKVLLNSTEVTDLQSIIRAEDEVEWVKPGGTKGKA